MDGLLYNESDLPLEEHYTDTHGYTEMARSPPTAARRTSRHPRLHGDGALRPLPINFAAFAMLGRRFAPRIRGLHKQRIDRIDTDRDYGPLRPLVEC